MPICSCPRTFTINWRGGLPVESLRRYEGVPPNEVWLRYYLDTRHPKLVRVERIYTVIIPIVLLLGVASLVILGLWAARDVILWIGLAIWGVIVKLGEVLGSLLV